MSGVLYTHLSNSLLTKMSTAFCCMDSDGLGYDVCHHLPEIYRGVDSRRSVCCEAVLSRERRTGLPEINSLQIFACFEVLI